MKTLRVAAIAAALLFAAAAAPFPARPKLVVLISIDQFRYDYLTRYDGEYTGGLRRLLDHGAIFANASLDHYPSVTAVGHATMLTGATPALSGIVSNEWWDRETRKVVTSVSDPRERLLGGSAAEGSSPRRLLVSTLGDEMKMADSSCRVIGVSIKDRAAILPSGHLADGAFWFDTKTGRFVSSSYYYRELPAWVKAFADSRIVEEYGGREWTYFGKSVRMPVEPGARLANALYFSPFGSELVERFAERAIEGEKLGQRGTTDLLTISISSIDAVGHESGPASPKLHDMAIQTDRTLGRLFDYLEKTVGLRNVLVVLTADHGVAELPETAPAGKMPGGRLQDADLGAVAEAALERKFGQARWVMSVLDGAVYVDPALIEKKRLSAAEVQNVAADALLNVPHVFRVYTREEVRHGLVPQDTVSRMVSRSLNWSRSGDLQVILEPHWVRPAKNTGHDTPFAYDTHIPLIFLGSGVKPGLYFQNVELNDLAPTLASLLSVQSPSGSVGRVLHEVIAPAVAPRRIAPPAAKR